MKYRFSHFWRKTKTTALISIMVLLAVSDGAFAGGSWLSGLRTTSSPEEGLITLFAIESDDSERLNFTISILMDNDDPVILNTDIDEVDDPARIWINDSILYWADALCEQTGGLIRLGNVYIFPDSKHQALADIRWSPSRVDDVSMIADPSGYRGVREGQVLDGLTIDVTDPCIGLPDPAECMGSEQWTAPKMGYTLAHETGHYVFMLFDEYRVRNTKFLEADDFDLDLTFPGQCDLDFDVDYDQILDVIMGSGYSGLVTQVTEKEQADLLNFSTEATYASIPTPIDPISTIDCNFDANKDTDPDEEGDQPLNNYYQILDKTKPLTWTAQGRAYAASDWEVLLRPIGDDEKQDNAVVKSGRTQYTQLEQIQDSSGDIQVPTGALLDDTISCRQYLNDGKYLLQGAEPAIWMSGDTAMQIVIDSSHSMNIPETGETAIPIEQVKEAASSLVVAVFKESGSPMLGVTAYNALFSAPDVPVIKQVSDLYRDMLEIISHTEDCDTEIEEGGTLPGGGDVEDYHVDFYKNVCKNPDEVDLSKFERNIIEFTDIEGDTTGELTNRRNAEKDILISLIYSITADGKTPTFQAACEALDSLISQTEQADERLVFLLSDGEQNVITDDCSSLQDVTGYYKRVEIPLSTIAYWSSSSSGTFEQNLLQMAVETGGLFREETNTTLGARAAFLSMKALLTSSAGVILEERTVPVGDSELSFPFSVDSTIETITVFATFEGSTSDGTLSEEVQMGLFIANTVDVGVDFACSEVTGSTSCSAIITQDDLFDYVGEELIVKAFINPNQEIKMRLDMLGVPTPEPTYELVVSSLDGITVDYPKPIFLSVAPIKGQRITGFGEGDIVAKITDPNGDKTDFTLYDNGENGDPLAGDGLYSAILDYAMDGAHTIEVRMDNRFDDSGTLPAKFTNAGKHDAVEPLLEPVGEAFTRSANIQVVVSGISEATEIIDGQPVVDDHENEPLATVVDPDNSQTPGRIEYDGDMDVFSVPVSGFNYLDLRLTDLAFNMEPQLRVERRNADGVYEEIIASTTIDQLPDESSYFSVSVPVDEEDCYRDWEDGGGLCYIHAFVTHADANAETGYYEFSAGSRIASDAPVFDIDIKPHSKENPINTISRGVIPVAVLGNEVYDVREIDPDSLAFGPDGASARHPKGGVFKDVNCDGLEDYLNFYSVKESGITTGDTQACLSGLVGGIPFTACDTITTKSDDDSDDDDDDDDGKDCDGDSDDDDDDDNDEDHDD